MKKLFPHTLAIIACISLVPSMALAQSPARKSFGKANPFKIEELPAGKLKSQLQALPPQARGKAMQWLHTIDFSDFDAAEHLRTDKDGGIFIVCPDEHGNCNGRSHQSEQPESGENNPGSTESIVADPSQASDPPVESVSVPVSSPPAYHSKPGATRFIYLDFNGAVVSGKAWSETDGTTTWTSWDCYAWSSDADRTTFSDAEQANIKRMWERVAEDYAPFDIDVTTDAAYDPDNYTGDKNKVGWLLITQTTDKNGARCPHYGSGGVAYVGVFGNTNYFSRYQPAWVTASTTSYANMMEAASHEMGHNMGLSHDGTSAGGLTYYGGHAATTTAPSWGPIMGTGYGRNVSQWCKGEYYDANQFQDDLSVISARVPYRADDHGNSFATATAWPSETGSVTQKGVVETTGNADYFAFSAGAGNLTFSATPYKCDTQTWGSNLDIQLELYDSTQTLVASSNTAADVTASISQTVPAGNYYLVLKPVAAGSPLTSPASGYTIYGSLGQYTITGTFASYQPSLGLTGITPASGDSGSTVTVDITGSALAADTTIKLKQPGRADITGTSVQMIGSTLRCQFDLTGAAPGLWSLHASNPNLQTATLPDAFTVNGIPAVLWSENFDGMPAGWTSTSEQGTNSWNIVSTASQTPAKSYFSTGPASTSITHLTSPSISIPSSTNNLAIEFWHNYALDQDRDCGKFQLSIDGGAWFEVTSAGSGAAFTQNGYNSTMAGTGQTNPYAGQQAWSGTTNGVFVKTAISLTDTSKYAGKNVRLRWTIATNNQTASTGWYVDSVSLSGVIITPNQPPSITTAASTSSLETESVGGTTYQIIRGANTNLSVSANDDVAESYLTYTWSSTSGPAPVVFSTNGNNPAKNTTVTFSQPGDYLLTVTVMDTGGLSATSSVNARVLETQTILVTPETVQLTVGDTRQYTATAINQFGTPLASQPSPINWSASGGGTITSGGLFTATTIGGPYIITASGGSLSGAAEVSISPYQASVELQNLNQFYDGSPKPVAVTTTPPGLAISVTYNGLSTAPSAAGSYAVEAAITEPNYQGAAVGTLVIAYKVAYHGNGNTSGTVPSDQAKLQNVDLTLATNSGNLNKADYSFAGWNTAADGSGLAYPAGGTYTGNASLTLYAVWIPGADGTWIQTTAGPFNWTDALNWSGGTIASGADRTANFTANLTANQAVNLDSARIIGNITFTDSTTSSNNLTVSGANTLTLDRTDTTKPTINVTQAGRQLTISSKISGNDGLRKTGPGDLLLSGANDFTGGTEIQAGTIAAVAAGSFGTGAVTFSGNASIIPAYGVFPSLSNSIAVNTGVTATINSTNQYYGMTFTGPLSGSGTLQVSMANTANTQPNAGFTNSANTFDGTLIATGSGTVRINSLPDSANPLRLGVSSTLELGTGTATSLSFANRPVQLTGAAGTSTLTNNNATSTNIISISQNLGYTSVTGNKTLALGGSNTGANLVSGNLANPPSYTLSLTKSGVGTWTISGTNTYSGATQFSAQNSGTLVFRSAASASPNTTFRLNEGCTLALREDTSGTAVFGAPMQVNLASQQTSARATTNINVNQISTGTGGTLAIGKLNYHGITDYRCSGATVNVAGANGYKLQIGSIDLSWGISGSQNLNPTSASIIVPGTVIQVSGRPATGTSVGGVTLGTGAQIFTLDGTTTGNLISGAIKNAADYDDASNVNALPLSLTKSGTGEWTLGSAANTFTGTITLNSTTTSAGTLSYASAAGSNPITFLQTTGSATLAYIGAAPLTMSGLITASALTSGTITLDASGITATDTISYSNPSSLTAVSTSTGTRNIVLTGANTGANTFNGTITNNSGSGGKAALTKNGTGTWVLTGANTYTGTTNVSAGKLFINGDQTAANGAVSVSANATLGGKGVIGGATTVSANGKLEFDISADPGTHDKLELAAGKALAFSGASTLTITSTSGASTGTYTLVTAPGGITWTTAPTVVLPAGWTAGAPQIAGVGNTDLVINITSTGAAVAPEIAVEQPASTDIVNNGSIDFGTVTLGSNTSLTFTIRNTGTADLNLTGMPLVAVSGTNTSDFTVTATPTTPVSSAGGSTSFTVRFTPGASGIRSAVLTILNNDSDEGTFTINISGTSQTQYATWAGGASFDTDSNGDGISNGLAWLLGASGPNASAFDKLPVVTQSAGSLTMTFSCLNAASRGTAVLTIEHSGDLGISDPWTSVTVPETSGSASGVTFMITPNGNLNNVTATIPSGEAVAGKLYGRLKGQP